MRRNVCQRHCHQSTGTAKKAATLFLCSRKFKLYGIVTEDPRFHTEINNIVEHIIERTNQLNRSIPSPHAITNTVIGFAVVCNSTSDSRKGTLYLVVAILENIEC